MDGSLDPPPVRDKHDAFNRSRGDNHFTALLKYQIQTVRMSDPHYCPVCSFQCSQRANLMRHINVIHGKKRDDKTQETAFQVLKTPAIDDGCVTSVEKPRSMNDLIGDRTGISSLVIVEYDCNIIYMFDSTQIVRSGRNQQTLRKTTMIDVLDLLKLRIEHVVLRIFTPEFLLAICPVIRIAERCELNTENFDVLNCSRAAGFVPDNSAQFKVQRRLVFWDMDNTRLDKKFPIGKAWTKNKFSFAHVASEIVRQCRWDAINCEVYGYAREFSVHETLVSQLIGLRTKVCGKYRESSDWAMSVDLRRICDNPRDTEIWILSSDCDFIIDITSLRARGFTVVVFHEAKVDSAHQRTMENCASFAFHLQEAFANLVFGKHVRKCVPTILHSKESNQTIAVDVRRGMNCASWWKMVNKISFPDESHVCPICCMRFSNRGLAEKHMVYNHFSLNGNLEISIDDAIERISMENKCVPGSNVFLFGAVSDAELHRMNDLGTAVTCVTSTIEDQEELLMAHITMGGKLLSTDPLVFEFAHCHDSVMLEKNDEPEQSKDSASFGTVSEIWWDLFTESPSAAGVDLNALVDHLQTTLGVTNQTRIRLFSRKPQDASAWARFEDVSEHISAKKETSCARDIMHCLASREPQNSGQILLFTRDERLEISIKRFPEVKLCCLHSPNALASTFHMDPRSIICTQEHVFVSYVFRLQEECKNKSSTDPHCCPVCNRKLSSRANMMRHISCSHGGIADATLSRSEAETILRNLDANAF